MYGMFSFRGEDAGERRERRREREDIYTTIMLEQEADGRWQSFLISRVRDKLLLMSDEGKKKKQFSLRAWMKRRKGGLFV